MQGTAAAILQSRPSAAVNASDKTDYGCNLLFPAASNLGPNNPDLVKLIAQRQKAIAAFDHVPVSQIPPDAVTASGLGLDPAHHRRMTARQRSSRKSSIDRNSGTGNDDDSP